MGDLVSRILLYQGCGTLTFTLARLSGLYFLHSHCCVNVQNLPRTPFVFYKLQLNNV